MSDILDRLRAHREGAPTVPISIPEWKIEGFIRPLSAAKHAAVRKNKDEARLSAQTIILCIVDEKGEPIFKDDAPTMAELVQQPSSLLARISMEIYEQINSDFESAKNS